MQPLSGDQRPDLLASLMINMSLVLRLPREIHLCRSSSNVLRRPSFLEMLQNPHVLLIFGRGRMPCACHTKRRFNVQKRPEHVVFCAFDFEMCFVKSLFRGRRVLSILTLKCASHHNGVHFLNIVTSKSAPNMVCFYILTSKFASRHNSVRFFDISTSKRAPRLRCLVHFDFEMCFAPQRRAIFHLSFGQMAPHPPL